MTFWDFANTHPWFALGFAFFAFLTFATVSAQIRKAFTRRARADVGRELAEIRASITALAAEPDETADEDGSP